MTTPMSPERFQDRWEHFRGEPQQVSGIWLHYRAVLALPGGAEVLAESHPSWRKFSEKPLAANPIPRPYFWQSDNGAEGWRQCQTSAIAMELAGQGVKGINDDLDYLKVVNRYGDTTEQRSHTLALRALGVKADFSKTWAPTTIKNVISQGKGFVAGVLHHGPVSAPRGGGHYILINGYTKTHWICQDPFGELNLVGGGWSSQAKGSGKNVLYSFANLNPRWDHGGERWGWVIG
jgi:hypothetical protein